MQKDFIYAEPLAQVQDFCFDATVADVFPDMIQRSVPGYQTIIQTIGKLTQKYQQPQVNLLKMQQPLQIFVSWIQMF
jgi:tRNA (cmo5U34)-methyltransferase